MKKSTEIRTGRHCVFSVHVHLVFVTKYRKKIFTKEILESLKSIFANVCEDFEAELVELEGEHDHVHLLVNYPPKIAISKLVNSLKGVSSRLLKKTVQFIYFALFMERKPLVSKLFCWFLQWSPN